MKKLLFKNWKTTLVAVANILVFALVAFGVIDNAAGSEIKDGVQSIIDAFGGGAMGGIATALIVGGNVLLLFAKDPDKKDDDV